MALIPLLITTIPGTVEARRRAWNWGRTRMRTLPIADGTIELLDRAHVLGLYNGAPGPAPPEDEFGKGEGSFTVGGRSAVRPVSGTNIKLIGGRGGGKGVGGKR